MIIFITYRYTIHPLGVSVNSFKQKKKDTVFYQNKMSYLERKSYIDRKIGNGCKMKVVGANRYLWVQIKGYGCKCR